MILRVVFLSLVAGPALIQAINIPVVCPCTFVANRAVKVVKNVLSNDKDNSPLPSKNTFETYDSYIQRVFSRQDNEPDVDYYTRIYHRYKDESPEKYIERIDTIYLVFPTLPARDNPKFWKFNENYYTLKYGRLDSIIPLVKESNDQYFARILRKEKNDDFDSYIKRLDCVFKAYPKLDIWRRIKFDSDSRNWYFYRHVAYNCAIRPSENIRESITTQYGRRPNEKGDDFSYFKRIVTRLTGETDDDYVERITRIRSRFGSLPLWYNCEYLSLIKDYYALLYAKLEDETPEGYYNRLTTKSTSEDFPTYVKRIGILQRVFCKLPLWNNCDYLQYTGPFYKFIYAKKPGETDEKYLKRIMTRAPAESLEDYTNRLNVCRWVNKESNLFYDKTYWPLIEKYYEGYFKKGKLEVDYWLARIFKRDFDENDEQYVQRCNLLYSLPSIVNDLSNIDLPESALKIASDYYRLRFKRLPNEDRQAWLQRVTKRLPIETDVTYETRLKYLENVYTDCRSFVGGVLKRVFGGKCSKGDKEVQVLLVKKKESTNTEKTEEKTENVCKKKTIEEEIEEVYGKRKDEDDVSWFKRLTKKSPDEPLAQYVKTLSLVRKLFPSIPLWYDRSHLELVKDYYLGLYARLPDETDENYCLRIVTREPWESAQQTADRVIFISNVYPTLPFWTEDKYFDLVKDVYKAEYEKRPNESYEAYIGRVLARNPLVDVSNEAWADRIHLIQKATASSPIWCDEKYFSLTKEYFQSWYKKDENEGCTTWLTRILRRLDGETEDGAIRRVRLIKQTSANCGCWTEFTFAKVAGSRSLSREYLNDIEREFFDSAATYEQIYSSIRSQKEAMLSSSSEQSVKVVAKA